MKLEILLSVALTMSLSFPLHAEEKSQAQLEEEEMFRKAGEVMEKMKHRVSPEQAELSKQMLVRALRDQFRNPKMGFRRSSTVNTLVLQEPLTPYQVSQLGEELEKGAVRPTKTETAHWMDVHLPLLDEEHYKLVILAPEIPTDTAAPFHGIKLVSDDGDVAEFQFTSQQAAPEWTGMIKGLQSAQAMQAAREAHKEARKPVPHTNAWTLERASYGPPNIHLEQTSMRTLLEIYHNPVSCGDGSERMKVDASGIEDRLDRIVADLHEKDLSWLTIFCHAADSIDCDVVIGKGAIRFIPR